MSHPYSRRLDWSRQITILIVVLDWPQGGAAFTRDFTSLEYCMISSWLILCHRMTWFLLSTPSNIFYSYHVLFDFEFKFGNKKLDYTKIIFVLYRNPTKDNIKAFCSITNEIWAVASMKWCFHIYKLDFMMAFIVFYLTLMEPCY